MASPLEQPERMERHFRGPDWRRQLAIAAAGQGGRRRVNSLDEATRRAAKFYALSDRGPAGTAEAARHYPEIAAAHAAWNTPALRDHLQLMLLGNLEPAEIAERLELSLPIVQTIEDLLFDVRSVLKSPTWVLFHAIRPEADKGHNDHAARMRAALYGGAHMARALLDASDGLPLATAERISAEMLLLHAKYRQCLEIPLEPCRITEFMEQYIDLLSKERRLELDREKFEFQVRRWSERRELAQARIALARERLAQQADRDNDGRRTPAEPETADVIALTTPDAA
jgi:hypothetical protein